MLFRSAFSGRWGAQGGGGWSGNSRVPEGGWERDEDGWEGGGGCTSQISSPMKYLCPVPSRAFVSAGAGLPVRRRGSALGSHLVHDGRVQLRELLFVEVSELGHWRAALGWLGARATQLRQSRSAVQLGCGARKERGATRGVAAKCLSGGSSERAPPPPPATGGRSGRTRRGGTRATWRCSLKPARRVCVFGS